MAARTAHRPRAMTAAAFLTAINAMTTAGIRRVFFTGGESLLSPLARPVLEGIPAQYTTTPNLHAWL